MTPMTFAVCLSDICVIAYLLSASVPDAGTAEIRVSDYATPDTACQAGVQAPAFFAASLS
ncbi:hypothetical protein OPAG_09121 [Rhodococcus opacus PD630]|nr:hypothetical protein OPAG_09121 [Rhodococcus opacus PD630]